jgi:transcriptional regulator GlxA family with amidase domain
MTGVLYELARGEVPTPYFAVKVVTADGLPVTCYNNLVITPHCAMYECEPDIVIIPGILNIEDTLRQSSAVIDWLQKQYERGTLLTSICSGSLLLAATGLLDGKIATTHWAMVNQFRKRFPDVQLKPDELITEDSGLVCSGGYNSFLDVSIYVIGKLCCPEVALQCSKIFLHDKGSRSQAPYSIFAGPQDHGDKQILSIQQLLEKEYTKNFDFNALAKQYGMGRRTLERHFKKATGETPLAYLQQIRVEHAKQLLESGNASFDEISYQVGYMDNSFFRKLFIKRTSLRPSEYRARFSCNA